MQPGLRTIEEELERVLAVILREPIHPIYASGRTDAGVHARGQVVNFHASSTPDLGALSRAISSIMRGELAVRSAEFVPDDFHARTSSTLKEYSYLIYNDGCPPVLDRGRAWYIAGELDIKLMKREAEKIVGEHDFTSLRAAGCSSKSPVKTIEASSLEWDPPYLVYRVVGRSFMKQMVRNIVGTLADLGQGKLKLKGIDKVLEARDRRAAGVTAPAYGLCLEWVRY